MAPLDDLFGEYQAAYREGNPDPRPFLARAPDAERAQLAAMIDAFLSRTPRREVDPGGPRDAAAATAADRARRTLTGVGGSWPSLLPSLRHRIKLRRADLVRQLAARLGAESQEKKVGAYYHQMEQGLLPAGGVSDTVLDALEAIVGYPAESLREAGETPAASATVASAAEVFARAHLGDEAVDDDAAETDGPDEVDRLFRGE